MGPQGDWFYQGWMRISSSVEVGKKACYLSAGYPSRSKAKSQMTDLRLLVEGERTRRIG